MCYAPGVSGRTSLILILHHQVNSHDVFFYGLKAPGVSVQNLRPIGGRTPTLGIREQSLPHLVL